MSDKLSFNTLGILLLTAFSQFSAQAKDTAYLNIHGNVIPSACNLDISDSEVDFTGLTKTMMQSHSEEGVFTAREKNVPFTITCNGNQLVAISAHADTIPTAGFPAFPTYDSLPADSIKEANKQILLAQNNTQQDIVVGTIMIKADDIILDNSTASIIWTSTNAGTSWDERAKKVILAQDDSIWYMWGVTQNENPHPARIINGSFIVNVNIDAKSVENMTTALNFSSGTTITLHYV